MTFESIRHAGSNLQILNREEKYLKFIFSGKSREKNITYEGVYKNFIDARRVDSWHGYEERKC